MVDSPDMYSDNLLLEALQKGRGNGVRIAIIDSGVQENHPKLYPFLLKSDLAFQQDFSTGKCLMSHGNGVDVWGHGTAIAGILHDLVPEAMIGSFRIYEKPHNPGSDNVISTAAERAIKLGYNILICSFGQKNLEKMEIHQKWVEFAQKNDVHIIAAFGEENISHEIWPGCFSSVIAVTDIETNDPLRLCHHHGPREYFSGRGKNVDVLIHNSSVDRVSGSSYAVPHVGAMVARILSQLGEISVDQMKHYLRKIARLQKDSAKQRTYTPEPLDTESVDLDPSLNSLIELLAQNAHDIWAQQRISQGWTYGEKRNDELLEHPDLVPYRKLTESEKEYDRIMSITTLKTIIMFGYTICPQFSHHPHALATRFLQFSNRVEGTRSLRALFQEWKNHSPEEWAQTYHYYSTLSEKVIAMGSPLFALDIIAEAEKTENYSQDIRIRQLKALALARSGSPLPAKDILLSLYQEGQRDGETMGILARTFKDLWKMFRGEERADKYLEQSHHYYYEGYLNAVEKEQWQAAEYNGVNAATTAFLLDLDISTGLTQKILALIRHNERVHDYWYWASLGEMLLLSRHYEEGIKAYNQATESAKNSGDYASIASMKEQVALILERMDIKNPELSGFFNVPPVLCLTLWGKIPLLPVSPEHFEPFVEKIFGSRLITIIHKLKPESIFLPVTHDVEFLVAEYLLKHSIPLTLFLMPEMRETKANCRIADREKRFDIIRKKALIITPLDTIADFSTLSREQILLMTAGNATLRAKSTGGDVIHVPIGRISPSEKSTWKLYNGFIEKRNERIRRVYFNREALAKFEDLSQNDNVSPLTGRGKSTVVAQMKTSVTICIQQEEKEWSLDMLSLNTALFDVIASQLQHISGKVVVHYADFDGVTLVFSDPLEAARWIIECRSELHQIDWEVFSMKEEPQFHFLLDTWSYMQMYNPLLKRHTISDSRLTVLRETCQTLLSGKIFVSKAFELIFSFAAPDDMHLDYSGHLPDPGASFISPAYLMRV